jgi:hypothetical protein
LSDELGKETNMKLKTRLVPSDLMLIAALQVGAIAANSDPAGDKLAIQQIMRGTWDKPEAPLRIEPIVAVSGWTQGDTRKRTNTRSSRYVRLVPTADICAAANSLFIRSSRRPTVASSLGLRDPKPSQS